MRKVIYCFIVLSCVLCSYAGNAVAHFGMIIPSTDVVGPDDKKTITLQLRFAHPFEGAPAMDLVKPRTFGVVVDGKVSDLSGKLTESPVGGKQAWEATYTIKRPGDYAFYILPQPYWEPAEDKFIVHATKVVVDAFGAEEGWDAPIAGPASLPCEIIPLTRPYSLYQGNVFTGQVFKDGQPVPSAEVEIEWWANGDAEAPTDTHITQVVKADENGIFSYAMPKAGWWGFAALMEGPEQIEKDGEPKSVEIGAVIWVKAYPME